MSELNDVLAFHKKFGVPQREDPGFMSREMTEFRVKFLQEELDEFREALQERDLCQAADALVDLAWVLYGTVLIMGMGDYWDRLWNEVKRANMEKVRATDASQSKRGTALDIIKPEGWIAPDHSKILGTLVIVTRKGAFREDGSQIPVQGDVTDLFMDESYLIYKAYPQGSHWELRECVGRG